MKLYELRSELVTKVLDQLRKTPDTFRIEREDKINLYKEEKNLKSEIGCMETDRDIISKEIYLRQYDALNICMFFPTEIKMLEMKQKLEDNPHMKEEVFRHKNKPAEKPEFQYLRLNEDGTIGNHLFIKQYFYIQ